MTYLRIHSRGHWLRIVHMTSDAGIRTLCGRRVSGFQAQIELSKTQPEGRICRACHNQLEETGGTP